MHVAICAKQERITPGLDGDLLAIKEGLENRGHTSELIYSIKEIKDPRKFDIGILRTLDIESPIEPGEVAAAFLEHEGVPFLDGYASKALTRSKDATHLILDKLGIKQPSWVRVDIDKSPDVKEAEALLGDSPVYAKPESGGRCVEVARFETALQALNNYESDVPWILQAEIKPLAVWRVITNYNGVVIAYKRLPSKSSGLASVRAGSNRIYEEPSDELTALSIQILEAVGGGIIGVDIIESRNKELYALELNSNFGFDLDNKDKKELIVNAIVDSLEHKLKHNSLFS